ncbi:hypothetical protein CVS40_11069 [Lucilia cuprina]|nr:hypothetical protein CVS40_11069 [Lucilia cuprina]
MLLQDLWKLKLDWDDKIPEQMTENWLKIKDNFKFLNEVNVPRHIICVKPTQIELHGFCDASMKAYGAAVYVKSIDSNGIVYCHLAASKSRIAPIKILSLPRLELCAGVLLVELIKVVIDSFKITFNDIFYYTDSSIVLSWLRLDPARLQIFVSNRVSFIQENSNINRWKHVSSEDNPADLISRGLLVKEIVQNKFWFNGPKFLLKKEPYISRMLEKCEIPEIKKSAKVIIVRESNDIFGKINHRNNFNVLQNIVAYVHKFIHVIRKRDKKHFIYFRKLALKTIVKNIQEKHFSDDLKCLKSDKKLAKSSNLITLYPFVDNDGLIRVGGRLENSGLLYEAKHPILLPYKNDVVKLMIEDLHRKHLHVGPQGLLAIVRQRFWPLRGRQLVKNVINNCYRCFRLNPRQLHQLMGNLPEDRVIRTRPFLNVGIDFLGPITIHYKVRGKKTDKSYVCVFVCFATKAVHLEVVSDLTSAAFIGALKRFVARRGCPGKIFSDNATNFRRGCPGKIFSDNATNFIGAANSLNEIHKLFSEKEHCKNVDEFCAQKNIEWLNIPARSPHVGGLWEACVKSVKKHFYKVTEGTMTYEELYTLMTQIESVLNSRPLTPLSNDPNDFQVLTPGHFLIGEPFNTFNDSIDNKCYSGLREHWKAVQSNTEKFWERWSSEYLSELQKRYKWNKPMQNIKPNTLALLKEDNIPPMSWRRGRVIRTITGSDGLCRIVEVRTSNGETKRSIHNVCPFPTSSVCSYIRSRTRSFSGAAEMYNR